MNVYVNQNGSIIREDKAAVSINNRSFRYGDGFFETMKLIKGNVVLSNYHFERLFQSLQVLQFDIPTYFSPAYFLEQIQTLAQKNGHSKLARIRLTMYRGNGGLYDPQNHFPNFAIQTWNLNEANNALNENGLIVDIFEDARKSCDQFSAIKSNNYLSYAMAALWAKKSHLNDAFLLNQYNRLADATIANVFIINNNVFKTPALSEGCVNGVMRKYLLHWLQTNDFAVEETQITTEDILNANELFLTNGIYGIRWVQQCKHKKYSLNATSILYKNAIKPLLAV